MLAGPIVSTLDYRWLFWIPMVVVGLTAVAAHLFVPESPVRTPGRIDWRATLLLSGWLVALLLPISQGASLGLDLRPGARSAGARRGAAGRLAGDRAAVAATR